MTVIYDYFPDIYLKFLITQLFLKIFPKYRKNFLKIACFKSFLTVPLNFLRISKHMSISSEFRNTYKFPWNFRKPFSSNYSQCYEKFYLIFSRNCARKFAWSLLLKILNTYFLKLFSYAPPLPHHSGAAPPPPHQPICRGDESSACEWKKRWLKDKVGSFETDLESNWKVESFKQKAKRFLKAKSKSEKKNWKAESQKRKFYLYHFFSSFHNRIAWATQKFHWFL